MKLAANDAELLERFPLRWEPFEGGFRSFWGFQYPGFQYVLIPLTVQGQTFFEARQLDYRDGIYTRDPEVLFRGTSVHRAAAVATWRHIDNVRREAWTMYMAQHNPPFEDIVSRSSVMHDRHMFCRDNDGEPGVVFNPIPAPWRDEQQ